MRAFIVEDVFPVPGDAQRLRDPVQRSRRDRPQVHRVLVLARMLVRMERCQLDDDDRRYDAENEHQTGANREVSDLTRSPTLHS